jgi:hypothetical protein
MAIIVYHHLPKFGWSERGYEYPLFWGLIMLAIVLRGGGPYSLDRVIEDASSEKLAGPLCYNRALAPVAQLDRVPGYEPGGRGFKSCRARQIPDATSTA